MQGKLIDGSQEPEWNTPKAKAQEGINTIQQIIVDNLAHNLGNGLVSTPESALQLLNSYAPTIGQYIGMKEGLQEH